MATSQDTTEQAVLNMLQRRKVLTIDEVLAIGQPDLTWNQVWSAVDDLLSLTLVKPHAAAYTQEGA